MKTPTITEAEILLTEAEKLNYGLWVSHSKIAEKCDNLDPDSAYILGLLHDMVVTY